MPGSVLSMRRRTGVGQAVDEGILVVILWAIAHCWGGMKMSVSSVSPCGFWSVSRRVGASGERLLASLVKRMG